MAKKFFYICAGLLILAATYHLGTHDAGAASGTAVPTEVATLSGVLVDGQTIPLPVYADGTTALESECKWTVSLYHATSDPRSAQFTTEHCGTDGRVAHCYVLINNETTQVSGQANYLIIATRSSGSPTNSATQSFGALKAKYR